MDGIETFLRMLEDGKWHKIASLAMRLGWSRAKTIKLAEFLSEHGLVHYRSQEEAVMLDGELGALLKET